MDWMMCIHTGEGGISLLSLLTQMLISSKKHPHIDTPRNKAFTSYMGITKPNQIDA